jgi:hypothetical protein
MRQLFNGSTFKVGVIVVAIMNRVHIVLGGKVDLQIVFLAVGMAKSFVFRIVASRYKEVIVMLKVVILAHGVFDH